MNNWFYAHNGEQKGPVSQEELARLASTGEFYPTKDLVWREGMSDWKKVAEVPELKLNSPSAVTPSTQNSATVNSAPKNDPYQPPSTSQALTPVMLEDDNLPEIEPGSFPLGITECTSRAFELTKRYFGIIIAAWAIYIGISFAIGLIFGLGELVFTFTGNSSSAGGSFPNTTETEPTVGHYIYQFVTQMFSNLISLFFTFGLIRIGLNLISGKPVEISMLFKEGPKLIRGILGALLYGLIVTVGLLLLIVPGIYWALKYCHSPTAIVDKDMGVMESFRYSAALTQNNKLALFGLGVLCALINIAGMLALCVGLIFTVPLTWLAWLVGYRWLQKGPAILQDRGLHRA